MEVMSRNRMKNQKTREQGQMSGNRFTLLNLNMSFIMLPDSSPVGILNGIVDFLMSWKN